MKRGTEEDDICNRDGCDGTMVLDQHLCFCSAISHPPCSGCELCRLICDTCDADPEDDEPLTASDKLKEYRYESKE